MVSRIPIVGAVDGTVDRSAVEAIFEAAGELDLVEIIEDQSRWMARDGLDYHAVVVFSESEDPAILLQIVDEAVSDPGRRPVIVVARHATPRLVELVLEAGAEDIIVLGEPRRTGPELSFAIHKAVARRHGPAVTSEATGQLVVVIGPKGGTGKTLTAANLTVALAAQGRRVTLVDLDLQFGDLGLTMGLRPEKTIYDLATAGGTLDAEKVRAFTCEHVSGARVLLAPVRPDQASVVTPDFLREMYTVLRESNDLVVVDTPPGFTAEVIATIDASSNVCLLGMLDAPSLKNAKLGLETLELMGYPPERIRLVLNRADTNVGISHADVVRILGKAPDVLVPSSRDIVRSINAGEPVVMSKSRTEASKAFQALADLFLLQAPSSPQTKRNGRGIRRLSRS
jgi:pilus assembly protein CpaE